MIADSSPRSIRGSTAPRSKQPAPDGGLIAEPLFIGVDVSKSWIDIADTQGRALRVVHDPVQAVFDRPMVAHDGPELVRAQVARGHVEACFVFPLGPISHCESTMTTPFKPGHRCRSCTTDLVDDGDAARLDAAVIGVHGLIDADGSIGEGPGFLLVCEQFDIVAKRAPIALQRQDC